MANEVNICNLALAHCGDAATVSSISPPDGSAQAALCAQFYPVARDALLEMHDWGFAMRRVALAELVNPNPTATWAYCYAQPNDLLNTVAVLPPTASDDTSSTVATPLPWSDLPVVYTPGGEYTPQPFILESGPDGTDLLYTNQADAVLRYVARVTDPTKFSPLFARTLAHFLASMLAGPLVKGQAGEALATQQHVMAFGRDGKSGAFGAAVASDSGQKRITTRDRQQVTWINAR